MHRRFLVLLTMLFVVSPATAGVCSLNFSGILDRLLGSSINAEEKVRAYIASSAINKALRSGRKLTPAEAQEVKDLKRALENYPVYSGEAVRLVKFDVAERFRPGEVFSDSAFFSASKGPGADVQGDFIFFETVLHIKGKSARDISAINPLEAEVVYLPGTKFRVTEKKGSFKFNDNSRDQIASDIEDMEDFGTPIEETLLHIQRKEYQKLREHFRNFDLEAFKRQINRSDLDESSIRRIRTVDDLLAAGFDPIIDVTLEEIP